VEKAGILLAIATGRRISYAAPALRGHGFSLEIPIISSNGAVTRTLGGRLLSERKMTAAVARGLCQLLRPFGALVFTCDRDGQTGSTQTGNPEKFA
jgi:hydroxymethylpyrimidine pyrophosphatase-like HAD family hydrolase